MTKRVILAAVLLFVLFISGLSFVFALEDGSQFVADLSSGITRNFYAGNVLGFNVLGGRHTFLMMGVKDDLVNVKVAEPAHTAAMKSGEEKRFDFNGDGIMDVYVKINSISTSGVTKVADITVRTIAESAVPAVVEPEPAPEVKEEPAAPATPAPAVVAEEQEESEESSNLWVWIVAGVVVIAVGVFVFMRSRKRH